jgi:hypothetical protein
LLPFSKSRLTPEMARRNKSQSHDQVLGMYQRIHLPRDTDTMVADSHFVNTDFVGILT